MNGRNSSLALTGRDGPSSGGEKAHINHTVSKESP